jgi:hypothetical protein
MFVQIALVLLSTKLFSILKTKLFSQLIALSFGIDYLISILRYSYFSGSHYFGIMVDSLRFVGFKFTSPYSVGIVNSDFPSVVADSFLKFGFDKIWNSISYSLLLYPALHLLFAYVLYKLLKKYNFKFKNIILSILLILFVLYVYNIINSDPRIVIFNK